MTTRRQRILDAAERLLQHYGPSKTTVSDIAREARVGVGTVYLEFANKNAIVQHLALSRHEAVLTTMREAAARPEPFPARLAGVFNARLDAFLRLALGGAHASDLMHCTLNAAIGASYATFQHHERALLTELLTQAAQAGVFDVPNPERTASSLLRVYASFSPPWIFKSPEDTLRQDLADLHNLVLRGLLSRR